MTGEYVEIKRVKYYSPDNKLRYLDMERPVFFCRSEEGKYSDTITVVIENTGERVLAILPKTGWKKLSPKPDFKELPKVDYKPLFKVPLPD